MRCRRSIVALEFVALAAWCASAASASSLQPYLVKDIDRTFLPADSDPGDFRSAGPLVFFAADDTRSGRELWRSDGTGAGTYQLVEACPGECSGWVAPMAVADGSYFFVALDESGRAQLWITDGTVPNTRALTSSLGFLRSGLWLPATRKLLFFALDDAHGFEPWVSDGTPLGTSLLMDLSPGAASSASDVRRLAFGSGALFTSSGGPALWWTDGTAAGTRLLRQWEGGGWIAGNFGVVGAGTAAARAIFVAGTPAQGQELWVTNGTANGTTLITEIVRGPGSPTFGSYHMVGKRYFFTAETPQHGSELWVTDGTAKGTKALTSFKRQNAYVSPYLQPFNDRLAFFANDGVRGTEPWTSDGTPKGTRAVAEVCPGSCDGGSVALAVIGKTMYFRGNDGRSGWELWATDGKPSTRRVADLCAGACDSYPLGVGRLGDRLLVIANDFSRLWSTDGSTAGTVELGPFTSLSIPFRPVFETAPLGSRLAFAAEQDADGMELWVTDATPAGTVQVADIAPATPGSGGAGLIGATGSATFFLASDGLHANNGLWRSDGSEGGTTLVRWLEPGEASSPPVRWASVALGESLYYFWRDAQGSRGLWRSDGTAAGTLRLTPEDVVPVETPSGVKSLATAGGKVFFFGRSEALGTTLWVSDGTPQGTGPVADLRALGVGVDFGETELVAFGPRVYFRAYTESTGDELWTSDGTAAGTKLAVDLIPGFEGARPHGFTVGPLGIFFFGQLATSPSAFWLSDGTPQGTVLLSDELSGRVVPTATGALVFAANGLHVTDGTAAGTRQTAAFTNWSAGQEAVLEGNRVLFTGPSCDLPPCYPDYDPVLWQTDGTAAGTGRVRDPEGNLVVAPRALSPFAGEVVFLARVGGDVFLWQTTSDVGGARPLKRIGNEYAVLDVLSVAGNRLFFAGYDFDHGWELWALRPE